jgi:hypothetical protein
MPGAHGIDSLIVGEYSGKKLMYVSRVHAGLVPASRRNIFQKFRPLAIDKCPFVNLPETVRSRWGENVLTRRQTNGTAGRLNPRNASGNSVFKS